MTEDNVPSSGNAAFYCHTFWFSSISFLISCFTATLVSDLLEQLNMDSHYITSRQHNAKCNFSKPLGTQDSVNSLLTPNSYSADFGVITGCRDRYRANIKSKHEKMYIYIYCKNNVIRNVNELRFLCFNYHNVI